MAVAKAKAKAHETSHERLNATLYRMISCLNQSIESATSYPDLIAKLNGVVKQVEKDCRDSYKA